MRPGSQSGRCRERGGLISKRTDAHTLLLLPGVLRLRLKGPHPQTHRYPGLGHTGILLGTFLSPVSTHTPGGMHRASAGPDFSHSVAFPDSGGEGKERSQKGLAWAGGPQGVAVCLRDRDGAGSYSGANPSLGERVATECQVLQKRGRWEGNVGQGAASSLCPL